MLQRFVDDLRQTGLLKNLGAMDAYCWQHGGSITEDRRSYGYIAETENYRFCLRCTPFPGEYQGYLYCYDLCQQEMYRQEHPVVGRVTFASGEQQEFTDSKALLQAIREELPFRSTTGFRFETLTDDPEVKKAVDDILLDFAGEDNSRRTCNYGLTETGKQALKVGGSIGRYPKFVPEDYVILRLNPRFQKGEWVQWMQEMPPGSPPELLKAAETFSNLKLGFRGDLKFQQNPEVIEVAPLVEAAQTQFLDISFLM